MSLMRYSSTSVSVYNIEMFLAAHTIHNTTAGSLLYMPATGDRDFLTEDGVTHTSGSTGLDDEPNEWLHIWPIGLTCAAQKADKQTAIT